MKFLVDEDVAVEVLRCLHQEGHEAQLVFDMPPTSAVCPAPLAPPSSRAATELREGLRFILGQVDPLGLVEAGALGGFELVLQVAQFVSPATLLRHGTPEPGNGPGQTRLSIGDHPFQELPLQTAAPQIPQEVMPGSFPLGFNDQKVAEFLLRAALKRGRRR